MINPPVIEMLLGRAVKGLKQHYGERHFKWLNETLGMMRGGRWGLRELIGASVTGIL